MAFFVFQYEKQGNWRQFPKNPDDFQSLTWTITSGFYGESLGSWHSLYLPGAYLFAAFTRRSLQPEVQPHLGVAILNALLGFQARIHRRRNLFVFASTIAAKSTFPPKKQRKKNLFQQKHTKTMYLEMTFQVLGPKVNHMLPVAYQFPCFHFFASLYEIIIFDMMFGMARQGRISKSAKNTEAGNQFLLQPGAVETASYGSYGVKHTPALWRKSRGWKIHFLAENYGFSTIKELSKWGIAEGTHANFSLSFEQLNQLHCSSWK